MLWLDLVVGMEAGIGVGVGAGAGVGGCVACEGIGGVGFGSGLRTSLGSSVYIFKRRGRRRSRKR